MKYLVMQCYKSYAVVLNEEGQFIKVANMNYTTGQKIDYIFPMNDDINKDNTIRISKIRQKIIVMVASIMIFFTSVYIENYNSYASIYLEINSQIKINLRKNNTVSKVYAIDEESKKLIEDYSYKNKTADIVTKELVKKAIDMNILSLGDDIILKFESKDEDWLNDKKTKIIKDLDDYLSDNYSDIKIEDTGKTHKITIQQNTQEIIINQKQSYKDSDYNVTNDDKKNKDKKETKINNQIQNTKKSQEKTKEKTKDLKKQEEKLKHNDSQTSDYSNEKDDDLKDDDLATGDDKGKNNDLEEKNDDDSISNIDSEYDKN